MRNLKWIKEDKRYLLKSDESSMIDLTITSAGAASFFIANKQYQVSKKGFFSPAYIVQSEGEEILKLSHGFWGSSGRIAFSDGSVYTSEYKNKGGLKMRFMDGENEILSYGRNVENKKLVPSFSIGISMVDADKLLILAALGVIIFQCLFSEDSSGDDAAFLATIAASS